MASMHIVAAAERKRNSRRPQNSRIFWGIRTCGVCPAWRRRGLPCKLRCLPRIASGPAKRPRETHDD